MTLSRSLTAITLITLSGLAAAQPARPPVAKPQARAEVRHDNRDIARHKHALKHSRYEVQHGHRTYGYKRVVWTHHGMRPQYVSQHRHHVETHRDVRNPHRK